MNLNESATWIADTRDPLYDLPFKSSTQVILMNDTQETIDHLLPQHLEATEETFKNLEILKDNDRSSRLNVTFIPAIDLKTATAFDQVRKYNEHLLQFPYSLINSKIHFAAKRWPKPYNQVLFDFRTPEQASNDKFAEPDCTFNKNPVLWGEPVSRPHLKYSH